MSNDLIKAFGDSLPAQFNPNALLEATSRLPTTGDKPYLMFKDGEWSFGVDHAEVDEDDVWAVNPNSFQFGLIEWCEGQAGGEILVPAGMDYSPADVARKFPDEPEARLSPQIAVDMLAVGGNYVGQQVNFKSSTRGGTSALNNLAKDIAGRYQSDPESIVPVVRLYSDSYVHKKYNRKTYVPIIEILFWDDMEFTKARKKFGEIESPSEKPDAKQEEPEPARRRRRVRNG